MSKILAEGLNHYTMVYGINSNMLKDKVAGHQSVYWKTMGECYSNIHAFRTRYERAKGYS